MQSKQEKLIEQLNQFAVMMMHINMIYSMQLMQEHDLSFTHLNSLLFIHRAGCTNIQCLADHLGVTKAAVSQMVDRLVESGLMPLLTTTLTVLPLQPRLSPPSASVAPVAVTLPVQPPMVKVPDIGSAVPLMRHV